MKALPKPRVPAHIKLRIAIPRWLFIAILILALGLGTAMGFLGIVDKITELNQEIASRKNENTKLSAEMEKVTGELVTLKNEDQRVKNNKLEADIKSIESAYKESVNAYEDLLKLKEVAKDTKKFDDAFAKILDLLSQRNYEEAAKSLTVFRKEIKTEQDKIAAAFTIPKNVPSSNIPPASGFASQSVSTDIGVFLVYIVTADMSSTHVYVDTASPSDCRNDCPTVSLAQFVSRNGAYAGINGSYFCGASYPSCADKKNSFDTLLMNRNKVYFNSDNNVYSVVPVVIFLNGSTTWRARSLEWGRDTSPDSVFAMQPRLLDGGNIAFNGDGDPKKTSKGPRSFVATKGSTTAIGVVFNAAVTDVAHVLRTLGFENALNLDSGGSTALWSGGYKVGPGRDLANVILFVRK